MGDAGRIREYPDYLLKFLILAKIAFFFEKGGEFILFVNKNLYILKDTIP